jgi:hypothetical protein
MTVIGVLILLGLLTLAYSLLVAWSHWPESHSES